MHLLIPWRLVLLSCPWQIGDKLIIWQADFYTNCLAIADISHDQPLGIDPIQHNQESLALSAINMVCIIIILLSDGSIVVSYRHCIWLHSYISLLAQAELRQVMKILWMMTCLVGLWYFIDIDQMKNQHRYKITLQILIIRDSEIYGEKIFCIDCEWI